MNMSKQPCVVCACILHVVLAPGAAAVKRVGKAHSDNFLELLAVHQQTILDWVRKLLRKVKKAFKVGGRVDGWVGC